MTRTFNAFAILAAMLVTTVLITPAVIVPADHVTITAEIA